MSSDQQLGFLDYARCCYQWWDHFPCGLVRGTCVQFLEKLLQMEPNQNCVNQTSLYCDLFGFQNSSSHWFLSSRYAKWSTHTKKPGRLCGQNICLHCYRINFLRPCTFLYLFALLICHPKVSWATLGPYLLCYFLTFFFQHILEVCTQNFFANKIKYINYSLKEDSADDGIST